MRMLRRFLRRLASWTTAREDEERRRTIAGGSTTPGGLEVRSRGSDEGELPGAKSPSASGKADPGFAPRAAPFANGACIHDRDSADAGAGHRRDDFDFHVGTRRSVEIPSSGESRGTIPSGLPLTLGAARFLASQLYGTNPYDPGVVVTAILTLGLSVLVASLIPAYRASLTSPLDALRTE